MPGFLSVLKKSFTLTTNQVTFNKASYNNSTQKQPEPLKLTLLYKL